MSEIRMEYRNWPGLVFFCDTVEEAVELTILMAQPIRIRHNRKNVNRGCQGCVKRRKRAAYWQALEGKSQGHNCEVR